MTPRYLFFPFTHIREDQLNTVLSVFNCFHYLSVTRDLSENTELDAYYQNGRIHPYFPSLKQIGDIERISAQYLDWAAIHKGNETNLKALLSDTPFFTHDTDVTAIKSQVLKKGGKADTSGNEVTADKHLLFLKMAQLCDAQQDDIDKKLNALDKNREALVNALLGVDSPLPEPGKDRLPPVDFGDKMTAERILSWTGVMAARGELEKEGDTPIFITTSTAVFDYLESNCENIVNPLDIKEIKVHENGCKNQKKWQHSFDDLLMHAVQGRNCREKDLPQVDDDCSLPVRLKLGLFSGENVNRVFNMTDKQIPVCLVRLK
jgi:hypothetical protein